MLSWHQPQPCRYLSTTGKALCITYGCHQGARCDRSNAWYLRKPTTVFVSAMPLLDFPFKLHYLSIQLF